MPGSGRLWGKQRRQPGKLLGGEPGHVLPLYPYLSPFRCHQPGRHPQESGFSTAIRPGQDGDLPRLKGQGYVPQYRRAAVTRRDMA